MMQVRDKKYCCYLFGSGVLDDQYIGDDPSPLEIPMWIQDQGEFNVDESKWDIAVGISHEDEEWRQDDDIKQFMVVCYSF